MTAIVTRSSSTVSPVREATLHGSTGFGIDLRRCLFLNRIQKPCVQNQLSGDQVSIGRFCVLTMPQTVAILFVIASHDATFMQDGSTHGRPRRKQRSICDLRIHRHPEE